MIAVYLESGICCFNIRDDQAERLAGRLSVINGGRAPSVAVCRSEGEFLRALQGASAAIVWTFRQEWFDFAPNLKAIFTPAAGRDYFKIVPPDGVSLHYGSFHGAIMGETAIACVLSMSHGILPYAGSMRAGCGAPDAGGWPRNGMALSSRRLRGATVLILGFGNIGRRFAKMAEPFGPRIVGISRRVHPEAAAEFPDATVGTIDDLDRHLPEADHIVCFLPSGAGTDDILDARRLALARRGAVVYNFGRGNAVNENALAEALASGHLGGAVLDVFKTEPLPAESPLRRAPNCWLFPHSSAFSPDYLDLYFESEAETLAAFA